MPYRQRHAKADHNARYDRPPRRKAARDASHDQLWAPDARVARRLAKRGARALDRDQTHHALREYQLANPARGVLDWSRWHYRTGIVHRFEAPRYGKDILKLAVEAPPALRAIHIRKASQLGYTTILGALVGYLVARRGTHLAIAQPTDADAREFRRDAITPLFDGIEELRLLDATARADQATTGHRVYAASSLRIMGGTQPGRWRRFVCDCLLIDERDAFPDNVGGDESGEGDVSVLALRPLQNRQGRLITGGTPTTARGPSAITRDAMGAALAMVYAVQCPECGELDDLQWERLRWRKDVASVDAAAETALHHCGRCGVAWPHGKLRKAIEGGRWVESHLPEGAPFPVPLDGGRWLDTRRGKPVVRDAANAATAWPRSIGLSITGLYSVWRSWPDLVALWLACTGDPAKLQAFTEQQLARPWERATEGLEHGRLRRMAQSIEGVPSDAEAIVVSMDVQKDWLSVLETAWARPDRGWVLARHEFQGAIETPGEGAWLRFADWLTEFHARQTLPVHCVYDVGYLQETAMTSMDTLWRRGALPKRIRWAPVKGRDGWELAPIRLSKTRGQRAFYIVGIYPVKRQQLAALGAGRIALSDQLPPEVFDELSGEEVRVGRHRGRIAPKLVQLASRIEAADCLTYAMAWWAALQR